MTAPDEKRACKGGETRCGQTLTGHVEECQACGTAIASDLIDHPFFGFAAGCMSSVVTSRELIQRCGGDPDEPLGRIDFPPEMRQVASPPAPLPEGWRTMDSAPKDGTDVLLWMVHANAKFSSDPVAEGWEAPVIARWIDFNGGGWTWHGLCGSPTHWKALIAPRPSGGA